MEADPGQGGAIVEAIIFLFAAVLAAIGVQRLRWSPVVGYLIAGAAIGPFGFSLVEDSPQIHSLAEFGIVFLMFTLGLELSFERLKAMRKLVFGLGGLQVTLTAAALAGIALLFGLSGPAAAVVGLALALSSTAVVMRLLMDEETLGTRVGRRAFGVLLFQDIAVVPILFLIGILADEVPSVSLVAFAAIGQAALAIVLVILAGRFLARPLFHAVAAGRSPELFAATALLLVLASAYALQAVGLSMALGAFLAGLLLAETEYAAQIELDIRPWRGLLLGLFFISVGMAVDPMLVLRSFPRIALVLVILLTVKAAVIILIARFFDLPYGGRLRLAALLAQSGEFSFVVFAAALPLGLVTGEEVQLLSVVVGLSIALTPALAAIGARLERRHPDLGPASGETLDSVGHDFREHVVIAGFGRVGRTLARMLTDQRIGYVALDLSPQNIADAAARNQPAFYGNASSPDILEAAGLRRAALLAITLDSPAAAIHTVQAARRLNPEIGIIVRARDLDHARHLEELGASAAIPETLEASLQLGAQVLRASGLASTTVEEIIERMRADDYALLENSAKPGPES